jgi:hypothetical protein
MAMEHFKTSESDDGVTSTSVMAIVGGCAVLSMACFGVLLKWGLGPNIKDKAVMKALASPAQIEQLHLCATDLTAEAKAISTQEYNGPLTYELMAAASTATQEHVTCVPLSDILSTSVLVGSHAVHLTNAYILGDSN